MKTNVLLALLLVCVAYVQSELNCSALSAVVEVQHSGYYRQYLQDIRPLEDVKSLFVEHSIQQDLKGDMKINGQASSLGRAILVVPNQEVFNGRTTNYVINGDVAKTLLQPEGVKIDTIPQQSVLFGLSNIIRVPGLYNEDPKDASITIVNTLVPAMNGADSINFLIVDASGTVENYNATYGAVRFQASAEDEKYYNVDGQVVGSQDKTLMDAAHVNYTSIDFESVSHQKVVATRLLSATKVAAAAIVVDFVAIVNTQDSIKLVRYQVTSTRAEKKDTNPTVVPKEIYSTVLIPRVDTIASRGAVIQVVGTQIYIAAHVSKLQSKAFAAAKGIELEFSQEQKSSTFLFRINHEDGKILWSTNAAISSVPHTVADAGFPAEIDVIEGSALVVSNTHDVPARTTVGVDATLKSYISHVTFDLTGALNKTVQSLGSLIDSRAKRGRSDADIANLRFVAYSVAFPLDNAPGRAVVGGTVGDHQSYWNTAGRLVLVRLNDQDAKGDVGSVYDLEVGYAGSNAVKIVRRAAQSNGNYIFQLGLLMNGPVTQPPANPTDDRFRSVSAGFWLVDCTPPNYKLEQIFTIVFYVIFGIVCFALVSAVVGFTIKGIYEYRKGKEERRSLLQ